MSETPALRPVTATIVMADIVQSTALYERVGNVLASMMVAGTLAEMTDVVSTRGGTVIKSLGDGLLCRFAVPADAVAAAMQLCEATRERQLDLRVGVHFGEVIEDRGDIFGDAVNTASRLADAANPGEVLLTPEVADRIDPVMRGLTRPVGSIAVKGKRDPLTPLAIVPQEAGETIVVRAAEPARARLSVLEVRVGDAMVCLDAERSELTFGRGPENDLVVPTHLASRQHGRIYRAGGRFMLVDRSANGTYVVPESLGTIYVHREETPLLHAGCIFLGADPAQAAVEPIRYRPVRSRS